MASENNGYDNAPPSTSPEMFLNLMYDMSSHGARHYSIPDKESQAIRRVGFQAWANHYRGCLDLIKELKQKSK